ILQGWVVAVTGDFGMLEKEIKDSIEFYVDCAKDDNDSYPDILDMDYTLQYVFDIQSLLCYYQRIFSYSALQNITGINQKQLCHYASGRSKPRMAQAKKIESGLHCLAQELSAVRI
ncbi:MAG: hypothetical protein RR938_09050, partial [Muribaculaceae bacterium]